jgi:hypothetical protein
LRITFTSPAYKLNRPELSRPDLPYLPFLLFRWSNIFFIPQKKRQKQNEQEQNRYTH